MFTKQVAFTRIPPPTCCAVLLVMVTLVKGVKYKIELEQSLIPAPVQALLPEILVDPEKTSVDSRASIAVQLLDVTLVS